MTTEFISVTAAVVSAIGGAFAAWAAFHSATSAHAAEMAAFDAERRAGLRLIGQTACDLILEGRRVDSRVSEAKLAYRTLFAFSGNSGGSREDLYLKAIDEKLKAAEELVNYGKLFAPEPSKLKGVPLDELDRVQTKLWNGLTEMRGLREDLEREYAGIEAQCAFYRQSVVHGLPRQ